VVLAKIATSDAQVIASGVLVAVTTVAAIIAALAVREARRTREQNTRPVLALDLVTVAASLYIEVGIVNVGQGAALDVDLELAFVPSEDGLAVRRRFNWPLIRPGQTYQFAPPPIAGQRAPDFEKWAPAYPRVALTGTIRDQLDKTHEIDLAVEDVATLRTRAMEAGLAGPRATPADVRSKKQVESTDAISSTLGRIEATLSRHSP
jgi:hypothetical protein